MVRFSSIFLIIGAMIGLGCQHSETTHPTHAIHNSTEALEELKQGNIRFLNHTLQNTNYKAQIHSTKEEQHPHSFVLSCIDSRIPPEIIFDQGIGNIFVARVAGNIENLHIIGSMEYAVKIKNVKLIVVMGHGNCGAIHGALDDIHLDNLTTVMSDIKPSLKQDKIVRNNDATLTTLNNIRRTMNDIQQNSAIIKTYISQKKLELVGAYYDVKSGEVRFI